MVLMKISLWKLHVTIIITLKSKMKLVNHVLISVKLVLMLLVVTPVHKMPTENYNHLYVHVKLVSMMMVLKSVKLVTILVSLVLITKNVMFHVLKTELMPHIVIAHQKLMIMVKLYVQIVVLNVKPVLQMLVTVPNVKLIDNQELNQHVHVSMVLSQIQLVILVLTNVLLVLSKLTIVNLVPKTESTFQIVSVHLVIMTMVFMHSVQLVLLHV
jgi:hypothetical protein